MCRNLVLFFFTIIFNKLTIDLCRSENVTYRGTMINRSSTVEDFTVLASWNANLIRWQLDWTDRLADNSTVAEYVVWLEAALQQFDVMLPTLRLLKLNVILDLHTAHGGGNWQTFYRVWTEKQFQDCFLSVWEMMANRYKNESQMIIL